MTTINILLILSGHLNKFVDMLILTHNHLFKPFLLGALEDINLVCYTIFCKNLLVNCRPSLKLKKGHQSSLSGWAQHFMEVVI